MSTRAGAPVVALPDWVRSGIEGRIQRGTLELPVLPEVVAEALKICRTGESDPRRLAQILYRDPALAGNLLRIVNSPMFGGRIEIVSLQQAVSRVGIRMITELMMSIATQAKLFEVPSAWRPCIGDLPRRSLVAALYAKEVARVCCANIDTAFLIGLMHELGRPVVMFILQRLQSMNKLALELADVEAAVRTYYAEVGAHLAQSWGLADDVVKAIRHHRNWQRLRRSPEGAIVAALADRLARAALPGYENGPESVKRHPALAALGLDASQVDALLAMRERIIAMADAIR